MSGSCDLNAAVGPLLNQGVELLQGRFTKVGTPGGIRMSHFVRLSRNVKSILKGKGIGDAPVAEPGS